MTCRQTNERQDVPDEGSEKYPWILTSPKLLLC